MAKAREPSLVPDPALEPSKVKCASVRGSMTGKFGPIFHGNTACYVSFSSNVVSLQMPFSVLSGQWECTLRNA